MLDALAKVDDPMHVRNTCSPDYLVNRAETTLGSIDKMQQSHAGYLRNMDGGFQDSILFILLFDKIYFVASL